jgi:hypothetical protein
MPDASPARTPVIPSSLHELIQSFRQALRDELNSRQTPNNGKPISVPLRDGRVQRRFGRHQRITFRSPMMPLQGYLQDTQGELVIDGRPHPCMILGLTIDQLTLSLTADLADYIPEARLSIDRMRLLLALDKRLANIHAHPQDYLTSLAMKCFTPSARPEAIMPSLELTPDPTLNPEQYEALLRAAQYDFSYIWGPPGTGKTMVIGSSTKIAYERGDRVLIVANTNTAVDQALESVLDKLPTLPPNSLIRYGLSADDAPDHLRPVTLEHLTEGAIAELQAELATLQAEEHRRIEQTTRWERVRQLHQDLQALDLRYTETAHQAEQLTRLIGNQHGHHRALQEQYDTVRLELDLFWNASRWRRLFLRNPTDIQADLRTAHLALEDSTATLAQLTTDHKTAEQLCTDLLASRRLLLQRLDSEGPLPTLDDINRILEDERRQLIELHQAISRCQRQIATIEEHLVQQARIVATTITRTYTAPILDRERFDVVIIDEGSMASPPALFTALCLARRQVMIVGDFLQLPPIAESTTTQAKQWLATDVYQLAGITSDRDPRVAALRTQYRMHPDIAAVAARLYQRSGLTYCTDDRTREARQELVDHAPIPGKALAFIDTSDRHSWVEKDHKGSPSNRYHATLAVALAQQALARRTTKTPTISIIAPYRNQVRVLQEFIDHAGLTSHVEVGTIHSFQGRQSDIVIFDTTVTGDLTRTMLGKCTGDQAPCKLMNVAFTRGKCKLLIIGHRPSIETLANVPDSLLWEALQLTSSKDCVYSSQDFLATTAAPPAVRSAVTPPSITPCSQTPATVAPIPVIPLKRKTPKLYLIRSTS